MQIPDDAARALWPEPQLFASGEFGEILVVEALDFAVDRHERRPHVQEILPRRVAVTNHPGVGALVEGIVRVDEMRPVAVALGEYNGVTVAGDKDGGAAGTHRLGRHRN